MFRKFFVILLVMSIAFSSAYSTPTSGAKAKKVPFYLRNDFDYKSVKEKNLPLFGRVKHTYVPAEVLKEVPQQLTTQSPDGFTLVNISPGANAQSETWIAINPVDPNNIIATSNDNQYMWGDYKMSSWASTDGGKTWKHANTPANKGYIINQLSGESMTIFDPSITFDTDGNAYYAYGFTQVNNNPSKPDDNGVFLAKSTDKGLTWGGDFAGDPIAIAAVETGNKIGQPFHDRYTVASDMNPQSPYKDNIYLAWQRFGSGTTNAVVVAISKDRGVSWSQLVSLYTGDDTQSPVPAVGPDGEAYVVWQKRNKSNHTTQAVIRKTENEGGSWTPATVALEVYTIGEIDPDVNANRYILADKQNIRASSYPAIAVDNTTSGSATRGNVYVVQAGREAPNGNYGIYLTMSKDKGTSWTAKKRIDDATLRNDMFFPAVSVDPTNGMISVFYYSSQNDPNNQGVDAYIAVSRDGGETFKNIRLTPNSIFINNGNAVSQQDANGSNIYWGDYTSITSYGGKIFPLWWWPTGSSYQYGTLDLFTALVSSLPKSPTDFDAISHFKDNKVSVELTWVNPTEDMLGGKLEDFKLEIFRNGQKLIELAKDKTEYTDATAVDGTLYTYSIRAVATNGDESPFAEKTLYAGGTLVPNAPSEVVAKPNPNGVLIQWINPDKAVDGSDIRGLEKIKIYSDKGDLLKTVEKESLNAGTLSSVVLNLPTEKFYYFKLKTVTKRNDVETESAFTDQVMSYAGLPIFSYIDNFDSEAMRIPSLSLVGTWGATSQVSTSNPNSLNQSPNAKYSSSTSYRLLMAPTVITNDKKTLNLDMLAKIHVSDFGHVFVSNDFGKSFIEIMRFNEKSHPDFQYSTLDSCKFVNVSHDLSAFIGDTLYFMIGLTTNPIREDFGLFFDNFVIDGRVAVEDINNPIYNSLSASVSPNPISNGESSLSMIIPVNGHLSVDIYDLLGNKISSVLEADVNAGSLVRDFYLNGYSQGTYFMTIKLNGISKTIPIIVQ